MNLEHTQRPQSLLSQLIHSLSSTTEESYVSRYIKKQNGQYYLFL